MNIRVLKDKVIIDGYVNAVERLSKPIKERTNSFVERVKVGAFTKALNRANDVRLLINHDWSRDLGGITDNNLQLKEDPIGLKAHAEITDPETVEGIRSGKIKFRGWSFGFQDRDVDLGEENGLLVRNVKDLDLKEVSLIDRSRVPAYDGTLVTVRSMDVTETLNVSNVTECDMEIRIECDEDETLDNHADDNGAYDYTKYHDMINEMKGE